MNDWTARGESAERIAWAQAVVDGMTAALAAGQPFWTDRSPASAPPVTVLPEAAGPSVTGPVYVLTDALCASACLAAIDLWKPLGAIQIGRETSADTVYMDTRTDTLPGGRVRVTLPMKIWRGRSRGHNVPERPTHRFEGDMRDLAALQAWVRTLP